MKYSIICSNKSILKLISIIFLLGLILGLIIYLNQNTLIKESISNEILNLIKNIKTTKQNNLLFHTGLISVGIILSLIILGLPFIIGYFFYESVSLGFLIGFLYKYHSLKGLLFGLVFFITNKLIYFLAITYLIISAIKYTKLIILNIKKNKKEIIYSYLIKSLLVFITIILNDVILHYFGNKILSVFLSLL